MGSDFGISYQLGRNQLRVFYTYWDQRHLRSRCYSDELVGQSCSSNRSLCLRTFRFATTAEPSASAAVNSELAAQSSWEAALSKYVTYTGFTDLHDLVLNVTVEPLSPSEAAVLYKEYGQHKATTNTSSTAIAIAIARSEQLFSDGSGVDPL